MCHKICISPLKVLTILTNFLDTDLIVLPTALCTVPTGAPVHSGALGGKETCQQCPGTLGTSLSPGGMEDRGPAGHSGLSYGMLCCAVLCCPVVCYRQRQF